MTRGLSLLQVQVLLNASPSSAQTASELSAGKVMTHRMAAIEELVYAGFLRLLPSQDSRKRYTLTGEGVEFAGHLERLMETREILQGETA